VGDKSRGEGRHLPPRLKIIVEFAEQILTPDLSLIGTREKAE